MALDAPSSHRLEQIGARRFGGFSLLEWAPPVLLIGALLLQVLGSATVHGPVGAVIACYSGASLVLLWRQRYPLLVLAAVSLLVVLPAMAWGTSYLSTWVLALAIGVFSVARWSSPPWSYLAPVAGVLAVLAMGASDPNASISETGTWPLNTLWIFAIGAWMRHREQLTASAVAQSEAQARADAAAERLRLSRDLHDVLAHNLAVMVLQAEAAAVVLETEPERARASLQHVEDTGRAALRDIRGLLEELRAADHHSRLDGTGGQPRPGLAQIPGLVETVRNAGLPVDLHMADDLEGVSDRVGEVGYRVVQEALTNALRHSGAAQSSVSIAQRFGKLEVDVVDVGSTPASRSQGSVDFATGYGLVGMRERVESIGGTLTAELQRNRGFRVTAALPIEAA